MNRMRIMGGCLDRGNKTFNRIKLQQMYNSDNFKIIAIRTGLMDQNKESTLNSEIKIDALKNLERSQIYKFRNEFNFPNNNFSEIEYLPDNDVDLYQLETSINKIPININAIVGGNGSGKSTLIELLYLANYNIGSRLKLLEDEKGKKKKPFIFLDIEMLYSISKDTIIKLYFKNGKVYRRSYIKHENSYLENNDEEEIKNINDLQDFFYTIVVNYSHYALNSNEIGDWIIPLFHKNDGYQTPIVLNPMRKEGNIDINKENYLLTRRLIANLLEPVKDLNLESSLRNIANNKIAKSLEITFNPDPYDNLNEPVNPKDRKILISAFKKYFNFYLDQEQLENDLFINTTLKYIHNKLKKMVYYKMFRKYKDHNSEIPAIKYLDKFIKRIYESDSHTVYKVKGAILYLKYYKKLLPNLNLTKSFIIDIEEFSKGIDDIRKVEPFFVSTFMMSPPSYFYVNIIPKDGSPFSSLSSGEKQKIHSISSIVYHLINLNSVEQYREEKQKSSDNLIHYKYINIVLDEIELYYHPEWQRTFIADLLDYISKINPENLRYIKGLNITFLTHSPYILSDIPNAFVLKLVDGKPMKYIEEDKTFGSNIHDLLRYDFFMNKGFMGEFARKKIDDLIQELKPINKISRDDFEKRYKPLIEIIGEPFIKIKILELAASKLDDDIIDVIINQRNREIEILKMSKKNKSND
jgi:hypothetical protein